MKKLKLDMSDTGKAAPDSLQRAIAMGVIMKNQIKKCTTLTAKLEDETKKLRQISETDLPDLLKELGITEFKLKTGERITVQNKVAASISKANAPEALAWMIKNKFGGLIKTQIVTMFGKNELTSARKLAKKLAQEFDSVTLSQSVHSQTLKSFVTEQLEAGDPIGMPRKLLGIHEYNVVKLTAK